MKILPDVTVSVTSAINAISDDKLAYLCNVKRLSELFYTGPRYLLSHNTTPAKWATIHDALGDGFITKYADPLCLLGTGFGANTSYIMFDIDRGSRNHPSNYPRAFERFLATLHKIGLTTPVIITSSSSGGIHVYYFFDRHINTFRIAALSQITLIDAKFDIKNGTLELFADCKPYSQKSNHKAHRLPLQPNGGGLILDRKGNPLLCGANDNPESQLQAFLDLAKASARGNDTDKIQKKLDPGYAKFKSKPSKYQHTHKKNESEVAKKWRENLEVRMCAGWTDYYETNELIQRFIEYGVVFMKLNNEKDLFEWAFEAITNANEYGKYCRHQHEIERRILDWIEPTLEKEFYVPYCGHPTRSIDRDNFISQHKHSKSVPTSKSEVYERSRVDSVVSTITDVVETILATIADLPSRVEDVIRLIQSIARKKFGQAPSRNTLYKPHYKTLWIKLKATNKLCDIVPVTSNTSTNMKYCPQTCTESAFEESVFCVTDLGKKDLKPIGIEISHSNRSVCSVNAVLLPPPANEADPDLDPDHTSTSIGTISYQTDRDPIEPELESDLSPDQTHSQSPTISNSIDFDINPQLNQIEPATANLTTPLSLDRDKSIELNPIQSDRLEGDLSLNPIDPDSIHSQSALASALPTLDSNFQPDLIEPPGVDLITRSAHNYLQSIDPDPTDPDEAIQPDPIDPDPIEPQSPTKPNLINLDSNPQSNQIEPLGADLIIRSAHDRDKPIQPDPIDPDYPSLRYFKKLSLDQKQQLTEQQMSEIRLSRFPLRTGSIIRPRDKYHVHGGDRGIVTQIQTWGVYVSWSDGTDGRYSVDDLIQTIIP